MPARATARVPLRLDLRRVFFKYGKEEAAGWSDALAATGGGGSLVKALKKSKYIKRKLYGYVLQVHKAGGQKLTWYRRGTKKQRARGFDSPKVPAEAIAADAHDEIARQFGYFDRRAK